MPGIMDTFEAILESQIKEVNPKIEIKTSTCRYLAPLSPCVEKILSKMDQDNSKKYNPEEICVPRQLDNKLQYRSFISSEKILNKKNENLKIISSNVQQMLSNFPDNELVINNEQNLTDTECLSQYKSHVLNYTTHCQCKHLNELTSGEENNTCITNCIKQFLHNSDLINKDNDIMNCSNKHSKIFDSEQCSEKYDNQQQQPLGSYLHTLQGIASRTPVGRKNMKYFKVTSEGNLGDNNTTSSDVSRTKSVASLGSCSSSESSSHHQSLSGYFTSAESLDSFSEPIGTQGSADSGFAEQDQALKSPEFHVLQEILETEAVYVDDLNKVIQGYLEPWRADPECPLSLHLQSLFCNLERIYEFHRSFLEDLRKANCEATKTANCFLHRDSEFSIYNEYCTNYPCTMEVLGQLTRDEKMAILFRERQIALGHSLPLGSYLLKPVQRILKYHLLLQRLSKQCDVHHKSAVNLALTTMTGIASGINSMKRRHEHAVRVQEIQSQLYGWNGPDLPALGELIAEGTFMVVGAKGRRHMFLFEKVLLLVKTKQDGVLAYKNHIMCSNLMLVEQIRGEPLCFHVLPFDNPRLQCTLKARSLQHKREWTLQIKRVILENYNAVIPNHARQLVLQLGQDLNNAEKDTSDKWSVKQYTTPHYLERRSRVRKTCDFSNRRATSQDRLFLSLGNWRRKSEPNMISHYNSKIMPKKISKLKMAKENSGSKFYMDLSDTETDIGESMETLSENHDSKICKHNEAIMKSSLEQIVCEILKQNKNFHKTFYTQNNRNKIKNDPTTVWYEDTLKLPDKADSLPRSFQVSDQLDFNKKEQTNWNSERFISDISIPGNAIGDTDVQYENSATSLLDLEESEHPEHKIYRKSAIRFSILQRIRHLMSEEQKSNLLYPLHKQGSKSMGEKIANSDYVDPQKLLFNSRNQINLSKDSFHKVREEKDIMDVPELLDLTINEEDVLNEIERRLNDKTNKSNIDSRKQKNSSSQSIATKSEINLNSSQFSDSYYEHILENVLTEEYVQHSNKKLVEKQDSFNNNNKIMHIKEYGNFDIHSDPNKQNIIVKEELQKQQTFIKHPNKTPPPVPTKPIRLTVNSNTTGIKSNSNTEPQSILNSNIINCNRTIMHNTSKNNQNYISNSTSWVKTMVERFE